MNGTQLTLEGCDSDQPDPTYNASTFTCSPDSAYTSGNLGKKWAELDYVPFRLTVGSPELQTFTIALAFDHELFKGDESFIGYDDINDPFLNAALSTSGCSIDPGSIQIIGGVGGVDSTMYMFVDVTAPAGTCVFDYAGRLSLTSAEGFAGSSLHAGVASVVW